MPLRPSSSPPPRITKSPNLASPARPGSCLGSLLCPSSSVPQDLVCTDCFLLAHCSRPDLPTSPCWPLPVPSILVPFHTFPVFFLRPPCHGAERGPPGRPPQASSPALGSPFGLCLRGAGSGPPLPLPSPFRFSSQWRLVPQAQWALGPGAEGALDDCPAAGPATYDPRPSAPARRGTGRRCPRPKPRSRSPGTPLRGAGSWPLVTQRPPLGISALPKADL